MLAELPADQAADETEVMARIGQFSLLNPAERAAVLASRTRAVHELLAHTRVMRDLAEAGGEHWGALVTGELMRRYERELAWLGELAVLVGQDGPSAPASDTTGAGASPADSSGAGSVP
jgi:hypothetical protein